MAVMMMIMFFGVWGRRTRGRVLLVAGVLLALNGGSYGATPGVCEMAHNHLQSKGFPVDEALTRPGTGDVCGADSCCGSKLENHLMTNSRTSLEKFLKESINKLSSVLDTRAKRFDDFFRAMMFNSKKEFHEMFKRTYGVIYLKHSFVFTDFFEELERYYDNGRVRLAEAMDTFFGILYQRMFTVINSQYVFDERYLECVAEHMTELKPFGDVPHKLGVQLRRSFVATRAYYKSLVKSADVVRNMAGLNVNDNCWMQLTKMQHCGKCKGFETVATCSAYCISVLKDCLRGYVALDNHWNNFVDALDKVADRLLGPFNVEMVVEPINIKISEAVMIFQESGVEVSQRIFAGCGKPEMGRRRRRATASTETPMTSTTTTETIEEPKTAARKGKMAGDVTAKPTSADGSKKKRKKAESNLPTMEKLIKDIKQKVKESRQFWSHLPYQFCNNDQISAAPSAGNNCWNGTGVGEFQPPDTFIPPASSSPVLNQQIFILQALVSKLQSAHQGQDVDLTDDSDELATISGSGSGQEEDDDGSGDFTVDVTVTQAPSSAEPKTAAPSAPATSTTTSTSPPPKVWQPSGAAGAHAPISLTRALTYYLMPIVLVWFGGAFADILL